MTREDRLFSLGDLFAGGFFQCYKRGMRRSDLAAEAEVSVTFRCIGRRK